MGKFGKKNVVSSDLCNYMLGIIGPAGFGKSSLMYNVCSKLYGDEGYIILDMGMEDGIKAITNAVYERVPNYNTLSEIVGDIVKNKTTDYPNLKVVVLDTLDAYFEIIEEYVIKDWNASNFGNPNFIKAKSINSVDGGFGRGMDRVIDVAKKIISRLNAVGVGVWWTAHVKEKDVVDNYTGVAYTQLTANMSKKYFDSVKNSTHVVGCGYYDRSIEKIEVGDENPVTKKKKQRNAVKSEARKIKFRDDMFIADSKSRFANIVNEIPLDADAFVKAITDAIASAQANTTPAVQAPAAVVKEEQPTNQASVVKEEPVVEEVVDILDIPDENFDKDSVIAQIRGAFGDLTREVKTRIVNLKGKGKELEDLTPAQLTQILEIVQSESGVID